MKIWIVLVVGVNVLLIVNKGPIGRGNKLGKQLEPVIVLQVHLHRTVV